MKLIVQVPCYNEEQTLPLVIGSIPRSIPGVDKIEMMIIDDGSTDRTVAVAHELGVHHVVRNKQNRGLAMTFATGIDTALKLGADIIVNTDGDNQYPQQDIGRLIEPILRGTHDIVIGDRQVQKIAHFSPFKKVLQKFGSGVVRTLAGVNVADAPSGFRAYSREAALSINVVSTFSYTMETIIQAGNKRIPITHVPIVTNPKTRESRLFSSMFMHVRKSMMTILRIYTMYHPFKVLLTLGIIFTSIGALLLLRLAYLILIYQELFAGHLQSLVFGSALMILGVIVTSFAILADLLAINRKILENMMYRVKKIELYTRSKNY
jgi:glycosyltransferase involved in cell wall biosynthesis